MMRVKASTVGRPDIAGAITTSVLQAFADRAADEGNKRWLLENPDAAARILRYFAALALLTVDGLLKSRGVADPSSHPLFRRCRYGLCSALLIWDSPRQSDDRQELQADLESDVEYLRILHVRFGEGANLWSKQIADQWFSQRFGAQAGRSLRATMTIAERARELVRGLSHIMSVDLRQVAR